MVDLRATVHARGHAGSALAKVLVLQLPESPKRRWSAFLLDGSGPSQIPTHGNLKIMLILQLSFREVRSTLTIEFPGIS